MSIYGYDDLDYPITSDLSDLHFENIWPRIRNGTLVLIEFAKNQTQHYILSINIIFVLTSSSGCSLSFTSSASSASLFFFHQNHFPQPSFPFSSLSSFFFSVFQDFSKLVFFFSAAFSCFFLFYFSFIGFSSLSLPVFPLQRSFLVFPQPVCSFQQFYSSSRTLIFFSAVILNFSSACLSSSATFLAFPGCFFSSSAAFLDFFSHPVNFLFSMAPNLFLNLGFSFSCFSLHFPQLVYSSAALSSFFNIL